MSVVQGFWHGKLGTMEIMSINSYLNKGHQFNLYTYDWNSAVNDFGGQLAPKIRGGNFALMDAESILPQSKVALFPWASIFSDFFRYALLNKNGGWWVDMDTICLRSFDSLTAEYVFARDNLGHDDRYVTGFVMKAPPSAPVIWDCYNWINNLTQEERSKLGHMDIGPYLLQKKVPEYNLQSFMAEKVTFDPIPWDHVMDLTKPELTESIEESCRNSYVIHLRQSIWNGGPNCCAGVLKPATDTAPQVLLRTDDKYPENSIWEILKRRYL